MDQLIESLRLAHNIQITGLDIPTGNYDRLPARQVMPEVPIIHFTADGLAHTRIADDELVGLLLRKATNPESLLALNEADGRMTGEVYPDPEKMAEGLVQIRNWALHAYPEEMFPEVDFEAVRIALEGEGISLGAVSGSIMRRAMAGIGRIAQEALEAEE